MSSCWIPVHSPIIILYIDLEQGYLVLTLYKHALLLLLLLLLTHFRRERPLTHQGLCLEVYLDYKHKYREELNNFVRVFSINEFATLHDIFSVLSYICPFLDC